VKQDKKQAGAGLTETCSGDRSGLQQAFAHQQDETFADPIVFMRHEVLPKVRPFALSEVLLDPGPLQ
jgi:hypothetical protein